MNIVVVAGAFPQVSETFIFRKVMALAKKGHEVTVLSRQAGDWSFFEEDFPLPPNLIVRYLLPESGFSNLKTIGTLINRFTKHWLHFPFSPFRMAGKPLPSWRDFLRYFPFVGMRADILHFEFVGLMAMYPLIREVLETPVVVSCRGLEVHQIELLNEKDREPFLSALKRSDAIHCVSQEMASCVAGLFSEEDKIFVNYPAIDSRQIKPPSHPASTSVRILSVGRLVWKKGYDYLLAALARLKKEGIDFQAEIIGDGPLDAPLRFSVEDLELKERVKLRGAISNAKVSTRLKESDIFVLPSHEEGLSNAALEAMAAGLPVVTTNAGGMAEAVSDGVEGFVVPVRDIHALANALKKLILDPSLREKMGQAARLKVEKQFSLERQTRIFEEVYERLAARGPQTTDNRQKITATKNPLACGLRSSAHYL